MQELVEELKADIKARQREMDACKRKAPPRPCSL